MTVDLGKGVFSLHESQATQSAVNKMVATALLTFHRGLFFSVMFAYEQCLLVLGHHPDVWYEAAQYLEQSSKLLAEKGVSGPNLAAWKCAGFKLLRRSS